MRFKIIILGVLLAGLIASCVALSSQARIAQASEPGATFSEISFFWTDGGSMISYVPSCGGRNVTFRLMEHGTLCIEDLCTGRVWTFAAGTWKYIDSKPAWP